MSFVSARFFAAEALARFPSDVGIQRMELQVQLSNHLGGLLRFPQCQEDKCVKSKLNQEMWK